MKILIIGGGMYVSGRGADTFGTILPAVLEGIKKKLVTDIAVSTTSSLSSNFVKKQYDYLTSKLNINIKFNIFPKSNKNIYAYKDAIKNFKPDACIIAVPDNLHFKIASYVIKHKINCLIVKPFTTKLSEAKKLYSESKKNNILGQVEFHKRFDESNLVLLNKIKNKQLGNLSYAVIQYSQRMDIPLKFFKKWSEKSNIFNYLGVHYVDLIYFLTNFTPVNVCAFGNKDILIKKGVNSWDYIHALIEWKKKDGSKFISNHITSWIDPKKSTAMSDQKISLIGSKSRIDLDQKNRGIEFVDDHGSSIINPYFTNFGFDPNLNRYKFSGYGIKSVLNFLYDAKKFINKQVILKNLEKNRPSFKNAIISTAVIEAVSKSLSNSGKKIKIKI